METTIDAAATERPDVTDARPRVWRWPVVAMVVGALALSAFCLISLTIHLGYGLFSHPPLYGIWHPALTSKALFVVPTGLLLVAVAWVTATARRIPAKVTLPLLIGAGLLTAAAQALVRGNFSGIDRGVSTDPGSPYYTTDLHYVHQYGIRGFIAHHAELALLFHSPGSRSHPAGPLLLLDGLFELFGSAHTQRIATAIALLAMCAAIPAWAIGRELGGARAGKIAAILLVAAPGPLLLAYTSMDAIYATGLAGAAAIFMIAIHRRSAAWAAAGGAVIGLVTMLTYATSFVVVATIIAVALQTRSVRDSLKLLGAAAAGGVAVVGLAWVTVGFNVIASYEHAPPIDPSSYTLYWFLASPAAVLIFAGVPVAALGVVALARPLPGTRRAVLPLVLIGLFVIWASLPPGITMLRQGETERTWSFLYPMLAAAAATVVDRWTDQPRRRWIGGAIVAGLVVLSVAQATVIQVLWDTVF